MASKTTTYVATRVQQLDAQILEGELESLFLSQLKRTLGYLDMFAPKVLSNIEAELELMIKMYLFRHSIISNDATLGQEMLNLKLVSKDKEGVAPLSLSHRMGLGFMELVMPYIYSRTSIIPIHVQTKIEDTLRAFNLLNFLVFLKNGRFRSLVHRILGVTCTFKEPESILSPVSYDYMNREILWFSFAEFASFILPLINLVKLKNLILGFLRGKPRAFPKTSPGVRSKSDLVSCAVCSQSPVNAREIGCNHCFCYYCLSIALISDQDHGFSCPKCNFTIKDFKDVRQVYLKGF